MREPPNLAICSWGIVPLCTGTLIRFFLAASTPLAIAAETSPALPRPQPTRPLPLPTTTIAAKLKARPPFVTFVTRLIATQRSTRSTSFVALTLLFSAIVH